MKKIAVIAVVLFISCALIVVIFFQKSISERFSNSPTTQEDKKVEQNQQTEIKIEQKEEFQEEKLYSENAFEQKVWEQRIEAALAPTNCPPATAQTFGELSYTGPLIDAHFHIANIPDSEPSNEEPDYADEERPLLGVNLKITNIICTLEQENTQKVFAFFPVYKEIPAQMVELVKRTMEKYPDKFVPFIMTPDNDGSPDGFPTVDVETLQSMLAIEPKLFRGYGEIGLYARGDHGGPKGSPELPPDSKRLSEIYPIIRENNLLVYFHLGEGQKESFEKVLEQNPDINFIFHGDQLISYENGKQNLKNIDEILTKHPNAYYGIDELYGDVWLLKQEVTKEEFFKHFKNYDTLLKKDLETWKAFIEKHPNQILWGTDRGAIAIWSVDPQVGLTLTNYARAFIARLKPEVQEKLAHLNAEKLASIATD